MKIKHIALKAIASLITSAPCCLFAQSALTAPAGVQNFLTLIVNSSDGQSPCGGELASKIFTSTEGVRSRIEATSNNRVTINGDVNSDNFIDINFVSIDLKTANDCNWQVIADEAIKKYKTTVGALNNSTVAVFLPSNVTCNQSAISGTVNGTKVISIKSNLCPLVGDSIESILSREFYYVNGVEYVFDDNSSLMNTNLLGKIGLSGPQKHLLGWAFTKDITNSGYYKLLPIEDDNRLLTEPQVYRLSKDDKSNYTLSTRKFVDSLSALSNEFINTISVHSISYDKSPYKTSLKKVLKNGDYFEDVKTPGGGLTVKFDGYSPANNPIARVVYGCESAQPSYSVTQSTVGQSDTQEVKFKVTNSDFGICDKTQFNIDTAFPSDYKVTRISGSSTGLVNSINRSSSSAEFRFTVKRPSSKFGESSMNGKAYLKDIDNNSVKHPQVEIPVLVTFPVYTPTPAPKPKVSKTPTPTGTNTPTQTTGTLSTPTNAKCTATAKQTNSRTTKFTVKIVCEWTKNTESNFKNYNVTTNDKVWNTRLPRITQRYSRGAKKIRKLFTIVAVGKNGEQSSPTTVAVRG